MAPISNVHRTCTEDVTNLPVEGIAQEQIDRSVEYLRVLREISKLRDKLKLTEEDLESAKDVRDTLVSIEDLWVDGSWSDNGRDEANDMLSTLIAIENMLATLSWSEEDYSSAQDYLATLREIDDLESE